MSVDYAWQKAYEALSPLVSDGDFGRRLKTAGWALSVFPHEAVPAEIQRHALIATKAFSSYPGTHPEGTISGLIDMLPDNRKAMLTEMVVSLFQAVCEFKGKVELDRTLDKRYERIALSSPDCWEFLFWNLSPTSSEPERQAYAQYARHWLPNLPDEVLFEWVGRHGYESLRTWGHLPLDRLVFEEIAWEDSQLKAIHSLNSTFTEIGPGSQGAYHLNRAGDWLGQAIRTKGTWPAPIVVFCNGGEQLNPGGTVFPEGFVLIEGHKRLCRLLNHPETQRQKYHRVWLGRLA
jgi:hypothetical protein